MDRGRVDALIKFILALAGQQDRGNREVGPIHLLKYIYLADLVHAERNEGATYTGASWRFHDFGPWAAEVFARIEPVVKEVGAAERLFSHPESDEDRKRWTLDDEDLLRDVERVIPIEISGRLKKAIREFGADTSELLRHVYTTRPMLRAKPGDLLDFTPAPHPEPPACSEQPAATESVSARRRRAKALEDVREQVRQRLAGRRQQPPAPEPQPRYDQVFEEGLRWLDGLAGEPITEQTGEIVVDDSVWPQRATDADADLP
jgi:hypothetical protein